MISGSFLAVSADARVSAIRLGRGSSLLIGGGLLAMAVATAPVRAETGVAAASAGAARDAAPGAEEADDSAAIVVTGTRGGASTVEKSLVPISVASGEDLARSGKQNLRDALAEVLPSYSVQAGGYQGQQGAGVRGARLKGLDVKDTLILVDGVRRHSTSLYVGDGAPTDLDLIPANAIDHIEILGDGAAAQYGSDAIAGVINIILKKTADTGGQFSVYYGQYGQTVGDLPGMWGRARNVQFHQGWKIGDNGGFFNASLNVQLQNGTNYWPAYAPAVLGNGKSQLYPLINGQLDPRETSVSRYRQWYGQPSSQTYSFAYNGELPISSNVTLYSNGTYAWRYSSGPGYFRTASSQSAAGNGVPSPQDPYANAPYTSGALYYPDGYLPHFDDKENDFQAVIGLKGDISGWDWNLGTSYGGDHARIYTKNSINVSAGPANWGQHDFYDGSLVNGQLLTSLAVNRKFDSGLFGQPLTVSAGIEHRYETYKQGAGELLSYYPLTVAGAAPWVWPAGSGQTGAVPNIGAQGMAGFTPGQAGSWSRNNIAAYLELNQKLTEKWTVDIAGRYEYYTDFGSAPSGQLSTRYEFSPRFAVRGTVGNGFSAPTLQQEHYSTQAGSFSVDSNASSPTFGQYRQQFSVSTNANTAVGQAIGVPQLKPEHALNASLGFVARPFSRTVLSVDGYVIDIRNRITSASATVTAGTPLYNALATQNLANLSSISFPYNGAHTFTKGFDLRLEHSDELGKAGTLHWTLSSNENVTSIVHFAALPAIVGTASAGALRTLAGKLTTYYPRNITSLALDWEYGKVNFWVKETHWGATEYTGTTAALDQISRPAFTTDASLSYSFTSQIKLTIGGTNVFDKRPTRLSAATQALQFIAATAVPVYTSYSPYGMDGGYYYGRLDFKW